MKLNQSIFSVFRTIRKSKAYTGMQKVVSAAPIIVGPEVLSNGNACHEKLQIIYANIRV